MQLERQQSDPRSLNPDPCAWHQGLPRYPRHDVLYCGNPPCDAVIDSLMCPGCSRTYPNPNAITSRGTITVAFGHAFADGTALCLDCWLTAEREELEHMEDSE